MEALDLGAFDFIPKPSGSISLDVDEIMDDYIKKIKDAPHSKLDNSQLSQTENIKTAEKNISYTFDQFPIIAIGASSGGPKVIERLITSLPGSFNGSIIIVQHMPAGFTKTFAQRLNKKAKIKVVEAEDDDKIKKDKALIAPGDYHLEVKRDKIKLNQKSKYLGVRPCVDYMMKSAAKNYQDRVIGVILTGMGKDGAIGMKEIKKYNGCGIVQDQSSALVYGMPQAVIDENAYDEICSLEGISEKLKKIGLRK